MEASPEHREMALQSSEASPSSAAIQSAAPSSGAEGAGIDNEAFVEESGTSRCSKGCCVVVCECSPPTRCRTSLDKTQLVSCFLGEPQAHPRSPSAVSAEVHSPPPSPASSPTSGFSRRKPVRFKANPVRQLRPSEVGQAVTEVVSVASSSSTGGRSSCGGQHVWAKGVIGTSMTTTTGELRPERRRGRHPAPPPPQQTTQLEFTQLEPGPGPEMLPDILNSHLPPPYTTLPDRNGVRRLPPPVHPPPPPPPHLPPQMCPGQCPPSPSSRPGRGGSRARSSGSCHPFPSRSRLRSSGRAGSVETDEPKHCCGVMVTQTVSIRWFIVMIAFVGLCCAIVGTVLGALKATGREHLTVSLLMIGVGIVLITVSGIAWRLTSHDAPSCRAMLGLQPANQEPNRRFMPRVPPYGRPPHPYAAMLYPEFQYRPPPPSYQASMQEYRLRLLLLDRQQGAPTPSAVSAAAAPMSSSAAAAAAAAALSPVSPPPTYRSYASSTIHSRPPLNFNERDYSRPPSYRSRASSVAVLRPGATDTMDSRRTLASLGGGDGYQTELSATPGTPPNHSSSHSRNPSLTLSFLSHESLFGDSAHSRPTDLLPPMDVGPLLTSPSGESRTSIVAGLSDESPMALPTLPLPPPAWKDNVVGDTVLVRKHPDINTVTIVQTTDSSQVHNQDTVIVAVTGAQRAAAAVLPSSGDGEVQILAQV